MVEILKQFALEIVELFKGATNTELADERLDHRDIALLCGMAHDPHAIVLGKTADKAG